VAAGETSWYGYAKLVIGEARAMGVPVKVKDAHIRAVASSEFPAPARSAAQFQTGYRKAAGCIRHQAAGLANWRYRNAAQDSGQVKTHEST